MISGLKVYEDTGLKAEMFRFKIGQSCLTLLAIDFVVLTQVLHQGKYGFRLRRFRNSFSEKCYLGIWIY